jgi:osmotically-inducible protein OsmY
VYRSVAGETSRCIGKRAAAIFALGSLLTFTACESSGEDQALAQAVKKPRGIGSPAKANAELEEAVRAKLDADPELKGVQLLVTADVTRNQVTLSGNVPSALLGAKAVELAKSAQAGIAVSNKISVKPKASTPGPSSRKTSHT